MTRSPRTITLFEEHPELRRTPVSFAASILVHCAVIGLVAFAFLYTPRIDRRYVSRFSVRQLDLQTPDEQVRRAEAAAIGYPGPRAAASSGKQSSESVVLPSIPHIHHGPQTLVQPDIKSDLTLNQIAPVPQVVLWTPSSTPIVKIVAPPPVKPPAAEVKPTLERPNPEPKLGDIALASSTQPSLKQLMVPSTTSPIAVRGPKPQPPSPPTTASKTAAKPAPAAVVSLSDVKMKSGTVTLPPVNESAASDATGTVTLAPGQAKTPSLPGNGTPGSKAATNGAGTGKSAGTQPANGSSPTATASTGAAPGAAGKQPAPGNGSAAVTPMQGGDIGSSLGDQASVTTITQPMGGQFGAVVVGTSLEDQYPEITDVWKGRMAYTVYLHVGLQKSWILQYSLPRDTEAGQGGSMAHLDAPWPFSIVRPNLPTDAIDADALMIHGYVNDAGKFETLSVVFPPQFPQSKFVLDSLQRWQFRPAYQNGQTARVEVLIIIPEEFE